ncbi:MAG: hypothetical protein ABIN36_10845 [Ferruginibacter sp.]
MNKFKVSICVFTSLLILHASSSCQVVFDSAVNTYLQGNDQKALEMFNQLINNKEQLLKNNKQLAASYMYRGATKSFMGNLDESLKDLDSAKAIDSTVKKLHLYYSKTYLFKRDAEKALFYSNLAVADMPGYADAYDQRAMARALLNDFKNAIADEDTAIKYDSTDNNFYLTRGWAKSELKQYKEAIADYDKSLKLKYEGKAFANRGLAYAQLKEYARAIDDYSLALAINDKTGDVYYYRGLCYKALNKKILACLDFIRSADYGFKDAEKEVKEGVCR